MLNQISPALSASRQFFKAMLQQTFGIDLHNDLLQHLDADMPLAAGCGTAAAAS